MDEESDHFQETAILILYGRNLLHLFAIQVYDRLQDHELHCMPAAQMWQQPCRFTLSAKARDTKQKTWKSNLNFQS